MFEGAEQFHQFLVSSRTTTTTLSMIPLSFPLDPHPPNPNPTFNSNFDPSSLFQSSQHPQQHQHQHQHQHNQSNDPNLLHHHNHHLLHHHSPPTTTTAPTKLQPQNQHQHQEEHQNNSASIDPWSANEVLALLRIRSTSIDHNWFPDFTWDHVSRKMGELGYKRSAENCKEKYEEETSINLNGINKLNNKFLISELEEQMFYQDHNADENEKPMEEEEQVMKAKLQEGPKESEKIINLVVNPPNPSDKEEQVVLIAPKPMIKSKKRKSREDKFEMFKSFCIEIVHKMLEKQEELHNKLIQDMAKRDEDKIAKDEAWKRQEMDRVNKEIEIRAHEQIIAGDRQATMIELLNKFTPQKPYPLGTINFEEFLLSFTHPKTSSVPQTATHELVGQPDQPNIPTTNFAKKVAKVPQMRRNPSLSRRSTDKPKPNNPSSTLDVGSDDIGRRWPRDEVQALIDMRCSLYNNSTNISNDDNNGKSGGSGGGSIWEKISQGMAELGYTRSAKRCKEKWENINKYFRKTKDLNKKRSLDSRTCPYFQQLSSLYNQTAVHDSAVPSDEHAVSHSTSTESPSGLPESAN